MLREIAVESIRPNEHQPRRRFDVDALGALAESIRAIGVLQPILVRPDGPDGFELVAGERRWRAARSIGMRTIPALIRVTADQGALERAIVENLHRQDLNPLEEAAALQQLGDEFGLTQAEVAERIGKSRSAVANTLRLLQLPFHVQGLVRDGSISAGHARALLGLENAGAQERLARRVVEQDLSVRQTEEAVRNWAAEAGGGGGSGPDGARPASERRALRSAAVLEVERLLADRLETTVEVRTRGEGGDVVVRFADLDDLERLVMVVLDRVAVEDGHFG